VIMDRTENPFLATLRLPVKISPFIVKIVIAAHIIALFIPWYTSLELSIKFILTCMPIASICFYVFKYYFYMGNQGITELILNSNDDWQVKMVTGMVHRAILGKSLFVHSWLVIITLSYNKNREYFILTPDIIDADQFRRLRVRLRFQQNKDI
jgi:membrane-bound toxin of toxin-antitoxin system